MIDNEDLFQNDIFKTIQPPHSGRFNLGDNWATNQDWYFVAKWNELFNRYCSARIFLKKTKENNYDYWFNPVEDEIVQKGIQNVFKAELFETALINYNILIDLSWTITYVSAEYVMYRFDSNGNVLNSTEIQEKLQLDEAAEMLRKTENGVMTPFAEGNPFNYLKVMQPEFSEAIDLIVNFWKSFSNSEIRSLYNYIKHKGKPIYKEIEDLRGGSTIRLQIDRVDYPSDIRDVQKIINLEEAIDSLIEFDDTKLYPYIKELIEELKIAVNPAIIAFL